jgi:HEAT repeat protein
MTALQVCAQRGFPEVLPLARTIASDNRRPVSLRLSAIATIGQVGNRKDDRQLLEKLSNEGNARLRKALQPALKQIQRRETFPSFETS